MDFDTLDWHMFREGMARVTEILGGLDYMANLPLGFDKEKGSHRQESQNASFIWACSASS